MPRAYDPNLDDPNEDDLEGGGTQTVAGSMGAASGATPAPSAQDRGKPTASGSWTNLDTYLQSNAGQGFGEKVAGKVGADVDQASGQIDTAAQEFKGRSDAGTTRADESLMASVYEDPTAVANDPGKLEAFKKQRDATYAGPSNFSDTSDLYGKTWGAVDSASQKAKGSNTEGGRYALLDNYFGRADYSQGQKGLDNLIVANDPNSRQAFENVRASADAAKEKFNTTGTDVAGYAAQNRGVTEATKKAAGDALAGSKSSTQQAIDEYFAGLKSATDTERSAFLENANSVDRYGVDPTQYAGSGYATDDAMQTATPEMRAKLAALAALSDSAAPEWASDPITSLGGADEEGFGKAVGTAKEKYMGQAKQLEDSSKSITTRRQELLSYLNAPGAKPIDFSPTQINAEIAKLDAQLADIAKRKTALDVEYGLKPAQPSAPSEGYVTGPSRGRAV